MDEQNTGSAGMTYFKWFCDQAHLLHGHVRDGLISYEDVGKLFLAVMLYVDTGEEPTFSGSSAPMLKMLFSQYRLDADRAKAAYEKKSATNRANGSKGGKAKAANAAAKKASAETEAEPEAPEDQEGASAETEAEEPEDHATFEPPDEKGFLKIAKAVRSENSGYNTELSFKDSQVIDFYCQLTRQGWKMFGLSVNDEDDIEALIRWRFCAAFDGVYWLFYGKICEDYDCVSFDDADDHCLDFCNNCVWESGSFCVKGKHYAADKWEEAINAFMN